MSITNEKKVIEAEVAQLQRRLDTLLTRSIVLDELSEHIPDLTVYPTGSIITFDHVFDNGREPSHAYSYAAIKCPNNMWYTSGPKSPGPYNSESLAEFIAKGNPHACYWEVTTMNRVDL